MRWFCSYAVARRFNLVDVFTGSAVAVSVFTGDGVMAIIYVVVGVLLNMAATLGAEL